MQIFGKPIFFLIAFSCIFNVGFSKEFKTYGVMQTKFSYYLNQELSNEFGLGKTAFGFDGDVWRSFGYRILVALGRDFKFSAFDVYGRFRLKNIEIRAGQFKPPFSMERLVSFLRRDFIDNAMATGLVPSRDMGIGFFGNFDYFESNLAIINGEGLNAVEKNSFKDVIFRFVPKYKLLRFGGAIYYGKSGEDSLIAKNRYNLQGEIKISGIFLRAEYVCAQDGDDEMDTYYLSAGYRFKSIEPALRYETADGNKRFTGGINLYLKGYKLRVQVNYIHEWDDDLSQRLAGLIQWMF